jgi:hypothetical protein
MRYAAAAIGMTVATADVRRERAERRAAQVTCAAAALLFGLAGAAPAYAAVRDPGPQAFIVSVSMARCPSSIAGPHRRAIQPCRATITRARVSGHYVP